MMETKDAVIKNMDHLGLVAGMIDELNPNFAIEFIALAHIIEVIDF